MWPDLTYSVVEVWNRAKAKVLFRTVSNFQRFVCEIVQKIVYLIFFISVIWGQVTSMTSLPIISQWGNIEILPIQRRRISSAQLSQDHVLFTHSWWPGPGANFGQWPRKRLFEVTLGHQMFLLIISGWEETQTWECSHCGCHIKTHRLMCNMTCLGHLGSSWPCDHVTPPKRWNVFFTLSQILKLTFQCQTTHVSTCLCRNYPNFLQYQTLFSKNHFQKIASFDIHDLWCLNHRPHLKSDESTLPVLF